MGEAMVGIDLGGTHFNVGLVDAGGAIVERIGGATGAGEGEEAVVSRLAEAVRGVTAGGGVSMEAVGGIGVAAPGAVDHGSGVVLEAPNLRWVLMPLRDRLAVALGVEPGRVVVENDVNAALMGERAAGAAAGMDDVLGVWVGTGVGAAMFLGGRLHRGATGSAGELGHTIVGVGGPADGREVEMLCSRMFVQRRLSTLVGANRSSLLVELIAEAGETLERWSGATLGRAYAAGDRLTVEVVDESAAMLGVAIANVLTTLGMSSVVLGGGMVEAIGKAYLDGVRASVEREVFPASIGRSLVLRATTLRSGAGIIGAAMSARG